MITFRIPLLLSGIFALLSLILAKSLVANSDVRDWHLDSGEQFRAELVDYHPDSGEVFLKFNDVEDRTYRFEDFAITDQAWLVEWIEFAETLDIHMQELGGNFEHLVTTGLYPTELFVYYPSTITESSEAHPALILFHPGGKAARYCMRHMEAAEATGMVLIACNTFRNTNDDFALESDMFQRFKEIFPQILNRVRFDHARLFMGGTSGGAWRAFHYSAWVDHPWAGIYSNVGWLGGRKYYDLPYPSGMRVAIVNGSQDKPAAYQVEPDSKILKTAGNKVAVMVFEGGHQVPPVDSQVKAFSWLLELEDFEEL